MSNVPKLRAVLLQVIDPHQSHLDPELPSKKMRELEQLVETLGAEVIESASQHRTNPHPATYIGGGKVEWLKEVVKEKEIDVVILNNVVKSAQLFRLEKMLWEINPKIKVWDRVDLILNIFDLHANTVEAKLQIQLARIQHIGPRIYGLGGNVLSKQGAGKGSKGTGETNIEFERRRIKKETQFIKKQLAELDTIQLRQIHERNDQRTRTAALVGYTSAGKTTLFNALTGKERETHKGLFTTLDSVVGKVKLAEHQTSMLVSDTIGFIEDLPPELIKAFKTSLMVSLEAQVLLHVIDSSDPYLKSKFETVEDILIELGVANPPILVFNKVDQITREQQKVLEEEYADRKKIFISAANGFHLEELKEMIQG